MIRAWEPNMSNTTLAKEMAVGLTGGLAGTIAMDLFGVGMFLLMGRPADFSFSIIGDAAAGFFSMISIEIVGGALLGVAVFYLIGLALGVILVALVSRIDILQMKSIQKGVGLGILYAEVVSLPMLATATIILKMTASASVQWFGISFVMHLIYGGVLGAIVSYRLRSA
jgi:hypothetical protein